MSNMGGLLFGPQCVIQSQNIPYEQNSYYRDFCELPQLQIAYLYIWTKYIKKKQGKSEGFDSCDRPSNLTQIGFK